MKTNRILFAITLISSPLLLNAYHEGSNLRASGGSTLANTSSQNTIRATGGSTLANTSSQNTIRATGGSTLANTKGEIISTQKPITTQSGIVAPRTEKTPILGKDSIDERYSRDANRRYFGNQVEKPKMVAPLRK